MLNRSDIKLATSSTVNEKINMVRAKANLNYQSINRNIEEISTINSQSTNSNHPVIIRLDRNNKTKRTTNKIAQPHFEEAFNAYSLKN